MSIVEGMCAGIPLILSDIPPHREILRNVEDFSFVRNSSPIEIAKIFKRLISDKSYYSYVSEKMIERSHDFSLQKMIAKYNAFYRSVSLNN
jgi:glycosyltransferase involved in cell wall biosynthesis